MNPEIQALQNKVSELESKINSLSINFGKHQHDGLDGTNQLRKSLRLDVDQYLQVGNGGVFSPVGTSLGTTSEQYQMGLSVGPDDGRVGAVNKANILQLDLIHQPNNTSKQSFVTFRRSPVVSLPGTTISTSSGGSTVTVNGFNFATNELSGMVISIYNSSGSHVETQTVASNTSTVITIDGTWGSTTSGGSCQIYSPVYIGSADIPLQRVTIGGEDVSSGGTFAQKRVLRFDYGTTSGANTLGVFVGTGSPESVVTANVGSLYLRKDGGVTTTLYVKTSGTSNTGWTAK